MYSYPIYYELLHNTTIGPFSTFHSPTIQTVEIENKIENLSYTNCVAIATDRK